MSCIEWCTAVGAIHNTVEEVSIQLNSRKWHLRVPQSSLDKASDG